MGPPGGAGVPNFLTGPLGRGPYVVRLYCDRFSSRIALVLGWLGVNADWGAQL